MLLNNKIRDQFNINIKDNIVIIDEAHNLLDTITDMYSATISLDQLEHCFNQLTNNLNIYMNRMKPSNIVEFKKLIFIIKRLKIFLTDVPKRNEQNYRILTSIDLMCESQFDNINVRDILKFCDDTRLPDKVHGYAKAHPFVEKDENEISESSESSTQRLLKNLELQQKEKDEMAKRKKGSKKKIEIQTNAELDKKSSVAENIVIVPSVIRPVLRFLECLADSLESGGILGFNDIKEKRKSYLKYLLLRPSEYFKDILCNCRSLILAGGTMQPTSEIVNMLLSQEKHRLQEKFFGHVVSNDACLPIVMKKGPRGESFLFTYSNRSNPKLFQELGSILLNVCSLVPHGVVCFFASYDYLAEFLKFIKGNELLKTIEAKKRVFTEPRNRNEVEKVLQKYRIANEGSSSGAILFSVIGGKLSEGLNFSDNLGRCVIVVGMPYPNKNSPELIEKMKNYNKEFGENAGSVYYENLCMKAVNQSIGRAIRHINDYASILLLDERYSRENVVSKLPQWIRNSLKIPVSYGQGQMYLAQFFSKKKQKQI